MTGIANLCIPNPEFSDSLSLFNPVYMYSVYGKMVYPVHGYFDNMPVHPPTFYLIQGLIFNITASKFFAFLLPLLTITLLYFISVIVSPIPKTDKILWIAPLCILIVNFNGTISTRPDFFLLIVFVTGLFYLELFKKAENKYLALLGILFLSFASILHYFASFAFLGYLIYIFSFTKRRFTISTRLVLYSLLLVILIIGGYIILHIIPNFWDIFHLVKNVNTEGSSLQNHQATIWGIPVVLISGMLLLFFNKKFLSLFLACVPLTFFVLFFSSGKSLGYYLCEYFIFYFALISLIIKLLNKFEKKKRFSFVTVYSLVLLQTIVSFNINSNKRDTQNAQFYRKVSTFLHGNDKVTASRMDLWYISGTRHYLNLNPILIWNSEIPPSDKNFAKNFDLIAEHKHMSNNTINPHFTTISSFYIEKSVVLNSYIFNQNDNKDPNIVFYSATPPSQFIALVNSSNDHYYLFNESDQSSQYYFISIVCDNDNAYLQSKLQYWTSMPLVDKSGREYQLRRDVKESLYFGIISKSDLLQVSNYKTYVQLIDSIPLNKPELISKKEISDIHTEDVLIYEKLDDLKIRKAYY